MTTLIIDLLPTYFQSKLRIRKPYTRNHYYKSFRRFAEYLGHEPTLDDLTDDKCTGFILWSFEQGNKNEVTANQRVKQIRAFWEWAARRKLVDTFPTFSQLEEPEQLPSAWTDEQLAALFKACQQQEGWIGPVAANLWWLALHWFLFDTGERITAALAVRWDWFDANSRTVSVPAKVRKGGKKAMVYRLSQRTCELLEKMRYPERDLIFVMPFGTSAFYHRYHRLIAAAGLPTVRGKCGPHKMRVTVFSLVEAYGGDATSFARHSSRKVTDDSYIDRRVTMAIQKQTWPREDLRPDLPKRSLLSRMFGGKAASL